MTKTFQVDEAGPPSDDVDAGFNTDPGVYWSDTNRSENDFRPRKCQYEPQSSALVDRKVVCIVLMIFLISSLNCLLVLYVGLFYYIIIFIIL